MNTTAGAAIGDDDIHAFREPPLSPPVNPAKPRRRRVWPWVLGGLLLVMGAVLLTGGWLLASLLDGAREGVNVSINGERWGSFGGFDLDPGEGLMALGGVVLALLIVLLVVPLAVSLALLLAFLGVAVGLGTALLAMGAVAAALLSPLWLLVLLLWLLLRRKPAATMRP